MTESSLKNKNIVIITEPRFLSNENADIISPRFANSSLSAFSDHTPPEIVRSEGFQFSFNDISKEEDVKKSWDPSPSPKLDGTRHSPIVEELSSLQSQIKAINSKLSQNLTILRDKQKRNQELKIILQKHEIKSTVPSDSSFIDHRCTCNQDCIIF